MNKNYKVAVHEVSDFCPRGVVVFKKAYETESQANAVAKEVLRRISDVYKRSYAEVLNLETGEYEVIESKYDAEANPKLSEFDDKAFLKSINLM